MEFTDYLKRFIRNYLIIFASIVIANTILRQIFIPDIKLELKTIYIYMICAMIGNLPSLIFYSAKEISEKGMRIRFAVHFVVLEGAILITANLLGWVTDILNTTILFVQIAGIYGLIRLLSVREDKKTANRINERLKKLKENLNEESGRSQGKETDI